jgi:hypothetical protein
MGIVGFFPKGPTDEATLITSQERLNKTFGGLSADSFAPLSMLAFFANGGRRAFVVRVVPSDAILADADLQTKRYDQQIETGTGVVVAFSKLSTTTQLEVSAGASPLIEYNGLTNPGVKIRWRGAVTAVVGDRVRNRLDTLDVTLVSGTANYEFRLDGTTLPANAEGDLKQFIVVPATVSVKWDPDGGGVRTIAIPAPVSGTVTTTAPNGQGSVVSFDHATSRGSVKFAGTDIPGAMVVAISFVADYTPTSTTRKIRDDGAGALVDDGVVGSLAAPGLINSSTGAYSFTTGATVFIPHSLAPLLATYSTENFDISPISKGEWANDVRVEIKGNADYFTAATQAYTRYDVSVSELNPETATFAIVESFEALVPNDVTHAQYLPDVLNELSDLISVTTPAGNRLFRTLSGIAATTVFGGGDGVLGGQSYDNGGAGAVLLPTFLTGLGFAIGPRSVSITYTSGLSSTTKTITDDGNGTLTGDVDPAYATSITVSGTTIGPNSINYTLGVANFKTISTGGTESVKGGTVVTAAFYTDPEETTRLERFGDTAKQYTDSAAVAHYTTGSDGTFTSGTFSRAQFTDPTLQATSRGVYALDKVDEIMQVIIPDFAGDVTVTGDLLDYAQSRANLPSGGDRFIILTVPIGSDAQEAVDWFRFDLARFSKFAALYWPWVKVADPLADGRPLTMPPLGHIAGIYARTDVTRNVGKSPGGTVDGALVFLLGLETIPTQGDRDFVYPNKVNPLISSPQTGLAVWGVRTIAIESEWRYINARRLFMFLEKSIYNSTAWIVFENNGPQLWARIKGQLDGFMNNLFNQGLFAGSSPSQAFRVVVDESNNDASSIEAGQVVIDVGAAPNKPAEFVRFRFSQLSLSS